MKSTDTKAKLGMMTYALIILAAAFIIAGIYFFFLTPSRPDESGPSHALRGETSEGRTP
jgi:hypothetical protein